MKPILLLAVIALTTFASAEQKSEELGDPVLEYLLLSPEEQAREAEAPTRQNATRVNEEEMSSPHRMEAVNPFPADAYLGLKTVPQEAKEIPRSDPELYLSLKEVILPLPQDYAKTYLKLKTLLDPTRTYVQVHVDKSRQRMWVYLDNDYVGDWKVSTARRGYWTPVGVYRPYTLHRMHYSRKYHNSPMPWSVFFKGGYAIHGTNAIRRLGRPASHGCIRVHPKNARKLYKLIKRFGKQNTRIIIRG